MKKYILVILYLPAVFNYAAASQYFQKDFNFSNLYTKNKYSAIQNDRYDPNLAIKYCEDIPSGGIWPEPDQYAPQFPSPNHTVADCDDSIQDGDGFKAQMAYGCSVDHFKPDSIGFMLSRSVVGVGLPDDDGVLGSWKIQCSGTIIGDGQWVITAAHCLTKVGGVFGKMLSYEPIYIVPWQKLRIGLYGIPTEFTTQSGSQLIKAQVEAAYIPSHYKNNIELGEQDIALLKLRDKLPLEYKPINLASAELVTDGNPKAIWSAGYGDNEKQNQDGQLYYRKSYYMTNAYDDLKSGEKSGNVGNLYYLNSMPQRYKDELSAWSLEGNGDSGGPILSYNRSSKSFKLEGVISTALYCGYAGYFAKLPYPYNVAISTTYSANKKLISSIINQTATSSDVRCISATGGCKLGYMYVANNSSHTIAAYKLRLDKNLEFVSATTDVNYLTQMATYTSSRGERYLLITTLEGRVLLYRVNDKEEGELTNVSRDLSSGSGFVDLKIFGDNVYVVDNYKNQIVIYKISDTTETLYNVKNLPSGRSPNSITIARTKTLKYYALVISNNPKENSGLISIYAVDKNVELNKYLYDIKLDSDMGLPIQITSPSSASDKVYLLTTKGIYVYRIVEDAGFPELSLQTSKTNYYDFANNYLKVLDSNTFAVSDRINNKVEIYKFNLNTLFKIDAISSSQPAGIEVIHSYSRDFMYVTNYDMRRITLFQGQSDFQNLKYNNQYGALDKSTLIYYVGD